VRQASGVAVDVGRGREVGVAGSVGDAVGEGRIGVGWFDGVQARHPPKSMSSVAICFIA
jgi:hypothetical protein